MKGHTTKSPLDTNKAAAWRRAWIRLWRSGSCVIDSEKLRRGGAPGWMGRMDIRARECRKREREGRDSRNRLGGFISESAKFLSSHDTAQGVVAWHWDSPVTTCKEDLEVIRVTVISNGHFNMPLGITNMPLRFTYHTVDHNSYRYRGLL